MTTKDVAPSVWQKRRLRIARERVERARRKLEKEQPAPIEEDDEEEEEERPAPRRGKKQKRGLAARSGKASAIVTRDHLKKQRGLIERTMAWLVLLISFVGAIAALHGGFAPLIASVRSGQYNIAALLGGVLLQLLLTFLEWYYFDIPKIAWGARIVDALTTAIGYGPLFLAPLALFLYNRGADVMTATAGAWAIIGLASLGIAWFPEDRLVD
jgi:hypothetical protein